MNQHDIVTFLGSASITGWFPILMLVMLVLVLGYCIVGDILES
jgi:hypothetical protein